MSNDVLTVSSSLSEAQIHFAFYRHLQNLLDAGFTYRGVNITRAEPEYSKNIDGFADIVIFDNRNQPWLVIEAKKESRGTLCKEY